MAKKKTKNELQMKYFVLKPDGCDAYAKASQEAMRAYADEIEDENPELSKDLIAWVDSIEEKYHIPTLMNEDRR